MPSRLNPYISFGQQRLQELLLEVLQGRSRFSVDPFRSRSVSTAIPTHRVQNKIMHGLLETDRRVHDHGRRHAARHGAPTRRQHRGEPER